MLERYFRLFFIFCLLSVSGASQTPQNAAQEFSRLRNEALDAKKAGNMRARLEAVLKLQKLLNDSPQALESAALAYADVGDNEHAMERLRQFVDMGQSDDRLLDPKDEMFPALRKLQGYDQILKRALGNKAPVSHAESAFSLGDPALLAEDIDYDRQTKSFLITSVLEKKIIRVSRDGTPVDFAQSPSHWPMMALKIDAAHRLVWATEVALDGFTVAPKSDWGRSAVLCFDLATGTLRRRIEGPAHTSLGDMALTNDGTPIVSDGDGGGVYRVRGDQLERIDNGEFISPQTPVMHPDGEHVFVPDYVRGIGVLDLASRQVAWLGGESALSGIDGLYFDNGWLVATQNGTSPERVIRFRLNASRNAIVSEEVIEKATATLGDPTHGVIVDGMFYYIANSGWDVLDDHGDLKAGQKMTPTHVMRFRIGG